MELKELFHRNGYVRLPHAELRERQGQDYKKGAEVRLVLRGAEELERARALIQAVGLKPAAPFAKGRLLVQPIYGRAAVEWFSAAKP